MKQFALICLLFLCCKAITMAQAPGTSCGQKEITDRFFRAHPETKAFQQQIENQLREYRLKVEQGIIPQQPNAVVTLPVVVHIIHNNGSENIPDAQVFTAIQHLNEAFANTGYYDPADGVNTQIQFCLAQRDPNNNPTNGIDRVVSPLTVMDGWNNSAQDMAVKNLTRWNPLCYVNIWIVKEIIGPVAGYAYLPSAHGMNIDGIVGEAAYFGSSYPNDVLIIHEMGHYLGLYHTFQGGCTNNNCATDGDQVCDTPPDQSTVGISCNSTANSCSTDALSGFTTDVNDLHQDYLDYGNWSCMKVFTQGQANRMNWFIQNVRKSLLACKSCMAPCPAPVTATFSSSANNISVGTTVNFTNSSVNASGYNWYINNVLQASSLNYSYTFNTVGTYVIKMSALTNNPLCDSAVKYDTIRVTCPVTANFTPVSNIYNINQTVNFTNTSVGGITYDWKVNNISQSTALNYSYTFSYQGYYSVSLTASNGFCQDTKTYYYTVIDTSTNTPPVDSCLRTTFQKSYSSINRNLEIHSMEPTADGGTVYGGTVKDAIGGNTTNALVVKLAANGNVQWANALTEIGNSQLDKVRQTRDGGYIGIGRMNPSGGNSFVYIVKLNGIGAISWFKGFGSATGSDYGTDIIELTSGDFAFTGVSDGGLTGKTALLCLINSTGNLVLGNRYSSRNKTDSRFFGVVEAGDTLVVSGDYIFQNNNFGGVVHKINKTTGAIFTTLDYNMDNDGSSENKIFKTGYGYLISSNIVQAQNINTKRIGLLRLKKDLDVITSNKLNKIDNSPWSQAAPVNDTGVIISSNATNSMLLFNSNPNAASINIWKKAYGLSIAGANGFEPVNPLALTNGYYMEAATYSGNGSNGGRSFAVVKADRQGNTPGCEPQEPAETVIPTQSITGPNIWSPPSIYSPKLPDQLRNYSIPVSITVSTPCSNCDSVFIPPLPPDTCNSPSFRKKIGGSGNDIAADIKVSSTNELLIAGTSNTGSTATNFEAILIKLDRYGKTIWNKSYGGSANDIFTKMVELKDGNYLLAGISQSLHDNKGSMIILKTDTSGNILWQKEHALQAASHTGLINITSLIELTDGSIAFCGNANGNNTDVSPNIPTIYNITGRFDNNGNMLWIKRHRYFYWESGYPMQGMIATSNSLISIVGDAVMKISQSDGTLLGPQKVFAAAGQFSSIERKNDLVILYTANAQLVLDTNLTVIKGFQYTTADPTRTLTLKGFSSESGRFMQGDAMTVSGDNFSYLAEFDENGKVIQAYKYPEVFPNSLNVTASRTTNDLGVFAASVTFSDYFNNFSLKDIFIIRTDGLLQIPNCPRISFPTKSTPANFQFSDLTIRYYPLISTAYQTSLQSKNLNLSINNLCGGSCNLLQLIGTDTVCSLKDTITIKATRNSNCVANVNWYVDTSVAIITNQTDSTISLVFKKTGPFQVSASISNGCSILRDSLSFNVFESPDSIYLGPDITLCKISTYTFNAGRGFKSYLWQDGSTDSTLTIYLPGTYHVTAEDYCGNKYRDTVIVTQSPDIPFDLGPDRSICIGDTITITAPAGFTNYNWSPDYKLNNRYSPTVSVSPIVDTTYMVIAEKSPGCLVVDSIRITVKTPSPLYIGKDTSFCQNDTLLINATPGFSTYQWNTGATSSSIKVTTAGNFSLIATDANGCRSKDTLTVLSLFPVPVVNLDNTSTLCDNIKRILDAGQHSSYLWQDGSTNRTYSVNNTGTYWVVVKDVNGCHNSDTSIVKNLLLSPSNFLDSSAEICLGQKLEIKAKTGYTSYRWNTNSSASLITVTSPGIYWVEVSNTDGCSARDTISVKAKDCIKGVYFPNAFTPNNDRMNNTFKPIVYGVLENFYMAIYNRYGQKVYETTDATKGWNGQINGQQQGTNTFVWTARYKFAGQVMKVDKGTVTLVR